MTISDDGERRSKYFEQYSDRVGRHHARQFEHEKLALEFAASALRALTYLNGGALVAIPAAAALFKADPLKIKHDLIVAGVLFVLGLLFVVFTQACVFFVEARRAEAETFLAFRQDELLLLTHYPGTPAEQAERTVRAAAFEKQSTKKVTLSNQWRGAALVWFWAAVGCFVTGCYFGAVALLQL